ncbi:Mu-like prophage major head subunit gpT family protein [Nitratireductor soli]|uniref:Mu-like prophage major head subunit gpT family protein n=1 Tax=Nitratireductor soli TaxID=1670619 RepID=UPI00065E1583|nr:Mu-like prophage major head subunit gpT family protein [Nitratireductor soli]
MIINSQNLDALRVGFSTAFRRGLGQATSMYTRVATTVPSSTKDNAYGWLGKMPNMREWIGPRHVHGISEHDYRIKNKSFELTISVDRDDIRDDNIGVYEPMFVEMGESVTASPDMLVWGLLKAGWTTPCYDGQNFFDTDHPVLDEEGVVQSVSNDGGGGGTAWYLLATRRALKPLIYQEREKAQFVAKDNPTDENVFSRKEFVYGVDGRWNVGFGYWQMAFGSRQTLNAANYEAARGAITGMKGDHGRPLGLVPDLLVVPPTLEGAGREILKSVLVNGGETNKWANSAELLMVPWLA